MNVLLTVFVLGFLIFIHELGHFLVAKYFKVKIETFSIGFGPNIFSFTKNETVYKLSLIPIGGFVKMEEDVSAEKADRSLEVEENGLDIGNSGNYSYTSFTSKKWWERALIVFAGPAFNLFLAMILIFFTFLLGRSYSDLNPIIESAEYPYDEVFFQGDKIHSINEQEVRSWTDIFSKLNENKENNFLLDRSGDFISKFIYIENRIDFFNSLQPVTSNIVGEVNPGMPAWKAGIQSGDRILMIDGIETNNWNDVRDSINNSQGEYVVLTIQREKDIPSQGRIEGESGDGEGDYTEIKVYPEINPLLSENNRIIGITQHLDLNFVEKYSFFESTKYGLLTTVSFVYMNYQALFTLVKNPSSFKNNVGGPIMVYYMTSQTSQKGLSDMLLFMAAISILLMIMNLLPIPVFDGGHIMFFLIEGIFGKPIPIKIQTILQQIGLMILIFLMVFAFYSDISRILERSF